MNSFHLKLIAIITMVIDHIGAVLYPYYSSFRLIGRISFVLFAFLLVQGFIHTSNRKKYISNLFIFALISEIPFDFAFSYKFFSTSHQNIFFTLALGLLMLLFIQKLSAKKNTKSIFLVALCVMLTGILANITALDYGMQGILAIFAFYLCENISVVKVYRAQQSVAPTLQIDPYIQKKALVYRGISVLISCYIIYYNASVLFAFACIAIFPILLFNGKKGRNFKLFFYSFYPLHLLLLAILRKYT